MKQLYRNITSRMKYSYLFFLFQNTFNWTAREQILKTAFDYAESNKLDGDYLEFGVHRGDSFVPAYKFAQRLRLDKMNFYAFDSFEGLPEIKGVDKDGFEHFKKGEFTCSEDDFRRNLMSRKIDMGKVHIIKGWFDKSLKEFKRHKKIKASIIYIDCDLYESTVPVLNFITDYIETGTIILFDDWFCFKSDENRGEQRAVKEWLNKNPQIKLQEFHKFGWNGNSFIVNKK